jgi:hypothetical protein
MMAMQFLWQSKPPLMRRPETYRCPSWSCASVDGGVWDCTEPKPITILEILEVNVERKDPTFEYGEIRSAILVVKCPLMVASWMPNRDGCIYFEEQLCSDYWPKVVSQREAPLQGEAQRNAVRVGLAELCEDAIEIAWDTEDTDFIVQVYCVVVVAEHFVKEQDHWAFEGLLLVAETSHSDGYRRFCSFQFLGCNVDIFEHSKSRTVTLY